MAGFTETIKLDSLINILNCDNSEALYPLICKDGTYPAGVERIYLDVVGLSTIEGFTEYFYALRFDMKLMESRFQRLFDMNYDVSVIARELATW